MTTPMSRRSFAAGAFAALLGDPGAIPVASARRAAQRPTDLSILGLPKLDLSLNAASYDHVPEQIPAGRYLVTVDMAEDIDDYFGTEFIRPAPGMSAHEFMVNMGFVADTSVATEVAPDQGFPDFIYESLFAGGPVGWPGTTVQAVVDLPPGEWIVLGDGEGARQPPVVVTATGAMPANLAEPRADISTSFIDFEMSVEGNLTAGDHVMVLQNHGNQPHYLLLGQGPEDMTSEQVGLSLMRGPQVSGLDLNREVSLSLFTSTQSVDTEQWLLMTLEPGVYVGTCSFPTAGSWAPHVSMGMYTVFTVE